MQADKDRFKFRMWDEKYNSMYYPGIDWIIEQDCKTPGALTLNRCAGLMHTLMQCTGKKDKNSKLIYEGDIVRLTGKNKVTFEYLVKYRLSEYRYVLEYANGKFKGCKARDFSKEYAQVKNLYEGGYEVIGNIYENPELLEVK